MYGIQFVSFSWVDGLMDARQDILPKEEGLTKKDFGQCAIRSDGIV